MDIDTRAIILRRYYRKYKVYNIVGIINYFFAWSAPYKWVRLESEAPLDLYLPHSSDRILWEKSGSFFFQPWHARAESLANSAGGIFPIAEWGLEVLYSVRQASILDFASFRLKNQAAFKHSCRKRLLKASMNALSVGFPGLEKSNSTPCAYAHRSSSLDSHKRLSPDPTYQSHL